MAPQNGQKLKMKMRAKSQKKAAGYGKKREGPTDEHSKAVLDKVLAEPAPKTAKERRKLKKRLPMVAELPKTAMLIRGNRGSAEVMKLLSDLHRMRMPHSTLYSRKHDTHPFEDMQKVEALCSKSDHTLFAFGSSSKKRPFRLIMGRMFNHELLDMQEYTVSDYQAINTFSGLAAKKDAIIGAKPLILFQGPAFETDDRTKRTKSLLLDWFKGDSPENVLVDGLETIIVCSAGEPAPVSKSTQLSTLIEGSAAAAAAAAAAPPAEDSMDSPKVTVRRYHINKLGSGAGAPRVELQEVGPTFSLRIDRVKDPDRDIWKQAIKVPKHLDVRRVKKNITKTDLGSKTRGRIHLGNQQFDRIHTVHHGKAKAKKLRADLAAMQVKKDRKKPTAPSAPKEAPKEAAA